MSHVLHWFDVDGREYTDPLFSFGGALRAAAAIRETGGRAWVESQAKR